MNSDLLEAVRENLDYVNKMINPVQEQSSPRERSRSESSPRGRAKTRKGAKSKAREAPIVVPETKVLATALAELQVAVCNLAEVVKTNQDTSLEVSKAAIDASGMSRIRQAEDDLDEEKQKNLKGKFIISSSIKQGKESFIKSDDALKADNKDLVDHVVDLALKKYEVTIPKTDIASCTRVHSGGIIFYMWNQKPGSAYHTLCKNIKSVKNLATNIYFNFMLTKRRSTLLFEARKLKRDNMITKFLSDEHGSITVKKEDAKEKIASHTDKETGQVKTWTVSELLDKYRKEPQ